MRSIEGRWSQDSHGLSVSSGEAACVSSNPTLEIYYCIVVTLAPPSSPTTTLSPVHSYGDPSSLMLDPSQAETTNEESLGIVASHQLLYIASHQLLHMVHRTHSGLHPTNCCTSLAATSLDRGGYQSVGLVWVHTTRTVIKVTQTPRLGGWGKNLMSSNENVDRAFSRFVFYIPLHHCVSPFCSASSVSHNGGWSPSSGH